MANAIQSTSERTPRYDAACETLRDVVQDRSASTFAVHAALAALAQAARAERVPPRHVLACLHGLVAKSPLATAHLTPDGWWYATARRLVATEYYAWRELMAD